MSIAAEFRFCARGLVRAPGFTLTATLTLALGIAASTLVFGVVNAVLLRPLPYWMPDRLVAISYVTRFGPLVPSPPFLAWTEGSRTFQGFAAYNRGELTLLTPTGEQVQVSAAWVSQNFLALLGASREHLGRPFNRGDDREGASPVVILDHQFWRRRFGSDTTVIGHTIELRGISYEVIGVTSATFRFPGIGTPDVLIPLRLPKPDVPVVRLLTGVIGRLRDGMNLDAAREELVNISGQAWESSPVSMRTILDTAAAPHVTPLQQAIVGDLRTALLAAFAAVVLVLLLACANVASLLVARAISRTRELAVRAALGASTWQLAKWVLAESLTLATLAGGVAVLFIVVMMGDLRELLFKSAPQPETIAVDYKVLVFAVIATLAAAALIAVIPIARIAATDLALTLKSASVGATRLSIPKAVTRTLVTGQVALAVVLLAGEFLFAGSLQNLMNVPLGFDPAQLLTFRVSAKGLGADQAGAIDAILARLGALPSITAAGASTAFPLSGHAFSFVIALEGQPAPKPEQPPTAVDVISPSYFRTLQAKLESGRDFDQRDAQESAAVAIVNTTFVRHFFPNGDPLGHRLTLGGQPRDANITIVGVVGDIRDGNGGEPIHPTVYRPFAQAAPQMGWHTAMCVVRTPLEPSAVAESIRQVIATIAPSTAVYDFTSMEQRLRQTVVPARERATLFGVLALAAVILTAAGLYAFLAYSVAESMHEFGVRVALGASRLQILRVTVFRALEPALWGTAVGVACALASSRVLRGLLYGVKATDVGTYVGAALLILIVSIAASVWPARRAMRADPLVTIRSE